MFEGRQKNDFLYLYKGKRGHAGKRLGVTRGSTFKTWIILLEYNKSGKSYRERKREGRCRPMCFERLTVETLNWSRREKMELDIV